MAQARINPNDETVNALVKMADGNPGAAVAIGQILKRANEIDPEMALGGLNYILLLDEYGIYGTDIYVLFSDICDKDLAKMLAVIRATQLGILDPKLLSAACAQQDYSGKDIIKPDEVFEKVKETVPSFDRYE